jgi:hypothetical protein
MFRQAQHLELDGNKNAKTLISELYERVLSMRVGAIKNPTSFNIDFLNMQLEKLHAEVVNIKVAHKLRCTNRSPNSYQFKHQLAVNDHFTVAHRRIVKAAAAFVVVSQAANLHLLSQTQWREAVATFCKNALDAFSELDDECQGSKEEQVMKEDGIFVPWSCEKFASLNSDNWTDSDTNDDAVEIDHKEIYFPAGQRNFFEHQSYSRQISPPFHTFAKEKKDVAGIVAHVKKRKFKRIFRCTYHHCSDTESKSTVRERPVDIGLLPFCIKIAVGAPIIPQTEQPMILWSGTVNVQAPLRKFNHAACDGYEFSSDMIDSKHVVMMDFGMKFIFLENNKLQITFSPAVIL